MIAASVCIYCCSLKPIFLDFAEIIKAYKDADYKGYIRPDHGRMIWGETGKPGYGLYDRALGIMYMNGVWDLLDRLKENK